VSRRVSLLLSVDFLVKSDDDVVELVHLGVNLLVDRIDFLVERVQLPVQRDQFLVLPDHSGPSVGDALVVNQFLDSPLDPGPTTARPAMTRNLSVS